MEEVENKREVRWIVCTTLSIRSNPFISSCISTCKHIIMFPHHLTSVCSVFFFSPSACRHFYEFGQTGKRDWMVCMHLTGDLKFIILYIMWPRIDTFCVKALLVNQIAVLRLLVGHAGPERSFRFTWMLLMSFGKTDKSNRCCSCEVTKLNGK